MVQSLKELEAMSDVERREEFDKRAPFTMLGTQFFIDEMRARSSDRVSKSVERLTRQIFWLTIVVTVATLVQLALAFASTSKQV